MSSEELLSADRQGVNGATILPINGRKFVVGLRWQTLKNPENYMREARAFGKDNGMDIVAIREGLVTQGGFVSKKSGCTNEMYSVASVLADVLGKSWLSVFRLDEDRYYLVAADAGAVVPDSDIIGNESTIRAKMMELNSIFEWANDQIIAPEEWSFGGIEKSLDSLLKLENVRREHKLKQLTFGLSRKEWLRYSAIVICLVAVGSAAWWFYEREARVERERIRLETEAQRAKMARLSEEQRRLIESSSLTRPWTLKPRAHQMLSICEGAIYDLPLSIGGWVFARAECSATSLDAQYTRTTGATNVSYLEEFARVFPDGRIRSTIDADSTAKFSIVMSMPAGGDEFSRLQKDIRNLFVSHFQKVDRAISSAKTDSRVIIPEFLPNGAPWPTNAPPPTAAWDTYSFNFTTADLPSSVLQGLSEDGLRIEHIQADFNKEAASFTWKTVGELYGLQ